MGFLLHIAGGESLGGLVIMAPKRSLRREGGRGEVSVDRDNKGKGPIRNKKEGHHASRA